MQKTDCIIGKTKNCYFCPFREAKIPDNLKLNFILS